MKFYKVVSRFTFVKIMNFAMLFISSPFLFLFISLQHLALSENVKVYLF